MKLYIGDLYILLLVFAPLGFWLADVGIASITESVPIFIASLGKAVALSGTALYLAMPILSTRLKAVNRAFGGLSNAYSRHGLLGKVSFWLIVAHPIFLGLGRWLGNTPFSKIWDWTSWLVLLGIGAMLVFIGVVGVSIYSHIKHKQWLFVHRIFGPLIIIFIVHGLLADNQLKNNMPLLALFLLLSAISVSAYVYKVFLHSHIGKKWRYVVEDVNHLSESVVELTLRPKARTMHFIAGQFAFLELERSDGRMSEAHPFSFSSAHNGPYARFTIKALGDETTLLQTIQPGAKALIEGPYGSFNYQTIMNHKQVWIAGGIGITPFLSMARSFEGKQLYDISLFYGTANLNEAVFLQEFIDITRHLPDNFKARVVSQELSGFVNIDMLQSNLGNLHDYDYLICGPPVMMKTLRKQLKAAGVPSSKIHTEDFNF